MTVVRIALVRNGLRRMSRSVAYGIFAAAISLAATSTLQAAAECARQSDCKWLEYNAPRERTLKLPGRDSISIWVDALNDQAGIPDYFYTYAGYGMWDEATAVPLNDITSEPIWWKKSTEGCAAGWVRRGDDFVPLVEGDLHWPDSRAWPKEGSRCRKTPL